MGVLRFVLPNQDDVALAGRVPCRLGDLAENMRFGVVVDILGCIEAQAVQVELADPVRGIFEEVLPDRGGVFAVEVDSFAPIGHVLFAEVRFGELGQVVAVGSDVVVNHIEDHGQTN